MQSLAKDKRGIGDKALRCLLALAMALSSLWGLLSPQSAYADTATIQTTSDWLDFTQTDTNTGNTWSDGFMYINGEVVLCIDITTGVVNGATYTSQSMDGGRALRIGLYDKYLSEAYPGWSSNRHFGYLQYMVWLEYSPDYMDAYVYPHESDFWDVYAGAKAYYEQNKDDYTAWGTEWISSWSQCTCIVPHLEEAKGALELTKTSGVQKLTDANGCYSLKGAVYGVYSDSGCTQLVTTMETHSNGYAKADGLRKGGYWMKEMSPSPGYTLDPNTYPVTVSPGQTAQVNGGTVPELPKSDPVGMLVAKADADLGATPQGAATLKGAEFTVSFYKGSYGTAEEAEASGAAERTWVFATDVDGFAYLSDEYKVSGDDFYYQSDGVTATLPLGTAVIQETKAPKGYVLDDGNGGEPKKFCVQITDDGAAGESVYTYNSPEVPDSVIRGGVEVRKADSDLGDEEQGDAKLEGAVLEITTLSENTVKVDGVEFGTGEVCKAITVEYDEASDRYIASCADCLPYGSYEIHEKKAPEGYRLNEGWTREFSISYDGQVASLTTDADALVDEVIRGGVMINKADTETDVTFQGDATFAGAVFDIVNESANSVKVAGEVYAPGAVVATITTEWDEATGLAVASTDGTLLPYGSYRIVEVEAPEGYLNKGTLDQPFEVREQGVVVDLTRDPIANDVIRGGVQINKSDMQTGLDAQGDATFEGAEFSITNLSEGPVLVDGKLYGPGEVCKVIRTYYDDDGLAVAKTASDCLPYGTYSIEETAAPEGYLNTGSLYRTFQIRNDGVVVDLTSKPIANDVIRGGVRIEKDDLELGVSEALGGKDHASAEGACLAGIGFTITNRSAQAVMVQGEVYEPGEEIETVYTYWSEDLQAYVADTPSDELPYGTYDIRETSTNRSYLLTDGEPRTFQIREEGVTVTADADGEPLAFEDQVVRNDMELSKMAEDTNEAIQAAFSLTNLETGETHVLVCDRNGDASTAASWNRHTANTNGNDRLLEADSISAADFDETAGVWFGLGEDGSWADPDDALAAMPYGHYVLKELRSDSNEGYELITRAVWVTRDSTVAKAAWMSLDDKPSERIRTQAADADDGNKYADADEQVTVTDTVYYENLKTDGRSYTVSGTLMLKATGEPLLDADGNPVTATKTFAPMASSGTVELTFTFDGSLLAGQTVVVFEDLYQDGELVAVHADIDDEGQSVKLVRIGTTATDAADGDKHVTGSDAAVDDEVAYEGLDPDMNYTLKATLMDAETGEPVQRPSFLLLTEDVTAEAEFKPEAIDGAQTVTLEFDASNLGGHRLVVFEELYDAEGELVAQHKDLADEGQTVRVPEIGTTLTDAADGDHVVTAGGVTLTDTVEYRGLVPGETYVAKGTLMVKSTGEALTADDGSAVTGYATFVPEASEGAVEVAFSFVTGDLGEGEMLVAFEQVLGADGSLVATHEDIDDEGQTVVIDNPGTPEVPDTPTGGSLPKTGDEVAPVAIAALAAIAAAASCAVWAIRRRTRSGEENDEE